MNTYFNLTLIPSHGLNNKFSLRFFVGSKVQYETPEEGWRTYQPKRCEYNNKDVVNSLNILSDKNYQALYQKFRLMKRIIKHENTQVSQKLCNILGCYSLWYIYHVTKAVQAMESTHCAFLHCVCDLKAIHQVNLEHRLIWDLLLYKFKLYYNSAEATKNSCCRKGKDSVIHNTVTRWFKKFHSSCKNLDNQARIGRYKTTDSGIVHQTIHIDIVRSTQWVEDELDTSISNVIHYLHKSVWSSQIVPHITKILRNFWITL